MQHSGTRNEQHGLDTLGLAGTGKLFWNLGDATLCERSIARGETRLSATGALAAETGPQRGASPATRLIVRGPAASHGENEVAERDGDDTTPDDAEHNGNAEPSRASESASGTDVSSGVLPRGRFDPLKADFLAHAGGRTLFAQDLIAAAGTASAVPVRLLTEHAWQALALRHLFARPESAELVSFVPRLTVLCVPSFKPDAETHGVPAGPVIVTDAEAGLILIAGTLALADIRAALLAHLGAGLAADGVLPMAAAAATDKEGRLALFVGRAGTGKTALAAGLATLSEGQLLADGAAGWAENGTLTLEAGAYPRADHLDAATEPDLFAALGGFGVVLENVALDTDTREPRFEGPGASESSRAAIPPRLLGALGRAHSATDATPLAPAPQALFLLSCDAEGILPPLARLTPAQAVYHFLSGYSARLPGSVPGLNEAEAAFAPGFADLFPLEDAELARLLSARLTQGDVTCWLVNTGWSGGRAGHGARVGLATTRRLVAAALDGTLDAGEWRTDPHFGFAIPKAVEGVDARLLDPARSWASRMDYARSARQLVARFSANFARFEDLVDDEVRGALPSLAIAAE